jgi:hypothetical protein
VCTPVSSAVRESGGALLTRASVASHDNPDPRAPPRRGRRCPRADSGRPSTGGSGCRRPARQAGCHRGTSATPVPPAVGSPAPAVGLACLGDGARQPVGRNEQHGGLPDREHGGVADRIRRNRTSVRLDICGKTSLLPRSWAPSGHLAALGVSLTSQFPATGNGSLTGRPKWPSFGCLRQSRSMGEEGVYAFSRDGE